MKMLELLAYLFASLMSAVFTKIGKLHGYFDEKLSIPMECRRNLSPVVLRGLVLSAFVAGVLTAATFSTSARVAVGTN
jgi:hypothetical protein